MIGTIVQINEALTIFFWGPDVGHFAVSDLHDKSSSPRVNFHRLTFRSTSNMWKKIRWWVWDLLVVEREGNDQDARWFREIYSDVGLRFQPWLGYAQLSTTVGNSPKVDITLVNMGQIQNSCPDSGSLYLQLELQLYELSMLFWDGSSI